MEYADVVAALESPYNIFDILVELCGKASVFTTIKVSGEVFPFGKKVFKIQVMFAITIQSVCGILIPTCNGSSTLEVNFLLRQEY